MKTLILDSMVTNFNRVLIDAAVELLCYYRRKNGSPEVPRGSRSLWPKTTRETQGVASLKEPMIEEKSNKSKKKKQKKKKQDKDENAKDNKRSKSRGGSVLQEQLQ